MSLKRGIPVLILLLFSDVLVAEEPRPTPPEARKVTYKLATGKRSVYLVQEPKTKGESTCFIIYLRGSGADEKQGMWLFPHLREIATKRNWYYVTPRSYRLKNLLADLSQRYGNYPVYLAGASLGGKKAYQAVANAPNRFNGMVLIGPAISRINLPKTGQIKVPVFLIYGELDGGSAVMAKLLTQTLKKQRVPILSISIPNGGHNAPCENIDWWAQAIDHVVRQEGSRGR
ncbi:MAG: alpha/beta fold hydrolase [Planctomycetota bacterium]|jgi:pimeloyl-ACP methyl ester carboxylesterase